MKRLKIVRRINLPETNSSSSHSVSISMSPQNIISPGDPDWDINIEDGILKIPGGRNFGWEYFKTNSLLTKLQYLCGIFCSEIDTVKGNKRIFRLKKILLKLFPIRDVEFEWITKYYEDIKEKGIEDTYYDYPEIDHNSSDIFEEITENINIIRQFLFSKDSWLYGGNDNSEEPNDFYNETIDSGKNDPPEVIISADFGGDIGRIDWEIKLCPDYSSSSGFNPNNYDEFGLLDIIYYDITNKQFIMNSRVENPINLIPKRKRGSDVDDKYLTYLGTVAINSKLGLLFISSDTYKKYTDQKIKNNNTTIPLEEFIKAYKQEKDYYFVRLAIKLTKYNWNNNNEI